MRAGKIISLTYQSFYHQEPSSFNVRPYCVKYFRSVPKHHSQKEIEPIDGWPAFTYHVAPTYDFKQELLSHGKYVEVLSPDWFRDEMSEDIAEMASHYGLATTDLSGDDGLSYMSEEDELKL